jgi:hypothetical protein
MALLLQIIGGLVLFVIVLALIAFFVLRWKLKKLAEALSGIPTVGNMAGGPPLRMRLRPADANEWDAFEVQENVAGLDRLGFERISAYESPDMPGLVFLPFASADQRSYALVYHQPGGLGVWCDINTRYQDGTSLTVTSAGRGGELEHRPGHEKAYLPGSSTEQLVEVHRSKQSDKPARPATIEGFANDFETAYEEAMAWRITKGYSDDEVRAVAALDGGSLSEDVLEQTRETLNSQAAAKLNEFIRRRYMEESGLTAVEWEDQRERLVIIHDRLTTEDVLEEVDSWLEVDEEEFEALSESTESPRLLMDRLNESQPASMKFRKLRTLHEPVEADVWLAPESVEV